MNTRGTKRKNDEITEINDEVIIDSIENETSEESTIAKRKKLSDPKILDGTYFIVESKIGQQIVAQCVECQKPISGSQCSTGNFIKHIRRIHPQLTQKLDRYLKSKINEPSTLSKTTVQPTLDKFTSNVQPEKV